MSARESMLAGQLYDPCDLELQRMRMDAAAWMERYNAAQALSSEKRFHLAKQGLGAIGAGSEIRGPIYVDYGVHIEIGARVFVNFNCTILDICRVKIGDSTMLGPGVQLLAADHPRNPEERVSGLECGQPIEIGARCWIGAGVLVLAGLSIGDDAIVGAGAVLTRDVPAGARVAGNPARPITPRG